MASRSSIRWAYGVLAADERRGNQSLGLNKVRTSHRSGKREGGGRIWSLQELHDGPRVLFLLFLESHLRLTDRCPHFSCIAVFFPVVSG